VTEEEGEEKGVWRKAALAERQAKKRARANWRGGILNFASS